MRKLMIRIGVTAALVVAAVAATSAAFLFGGRGETAPVVNVTNLRQQILSIGELATLQYDYTNVIDSKDSLTINGWAVPGTAKSMIVAFDGTMKIGIHASGVLVDTDEQTQAVSITVPRASILSHEIHEKTVRVLDQKSGLFNPVQVEDYTKMAASQKLAMEKRAAKSDMFARAEADAVKMLRTLAQGIVPAEYTVEVAVAAGP